MSHTQIMNTMQRHLQTIFGKRFPVTATNFFTTGNGCHFEGGKLKGMRTVVMSSAELKAMQAKGFIGASGWSLK